MEQQQDQGIKYLFNNLPSLEQLQDMEVFLMRKANISDPRAFDDMHMDEFLGYIDKVDKQFKREQRQREKQMEQG